MLIVRDSQMTALERQARARFIGQLTDIMTADFPTHVDMLGLPTFRQVVHDAIGQAEGFGLRQADQITDFVCAVLCCGEKFYDRHDFAWARALLESADANRAAIMLDRVLDALRTMATRSAGQP